MKHWQRRLWVNGVRLLTTLLIAAGLLVGAFRLGVALVPEYRAEVESRVATLLGAPVDIEQMNLIWRGRYPTLTLRQVVIGKPGDAQLRVAELQLGMSPLRLLRGEIMPALVGLRGTRLLLQREQGQIRLGGLQAEGGEQRPPTQFLDQLRRIGHVLLTDSTLIWEDLDAGLAPRPVEIISLRVERNFRGLRLRGDVHVSDQPGSRVSADAQLRQSPWRLLSLDVESRRFQPWPELARYLPELPALEGKLDMLSAQSYWDEGRLAEASVDFDLNGIRPAGQDAGFERWGGQLRVTAQGEAYRLELDSHTLVGPSGRWPAQLLSLDWTPGQPGLDLSTQYLRLDDLHVWLPLLPEDLAAQLAELRLSGELRQLLVQQLGVAERMRLSARLDRVGVAQSGDYPGLRGVSGVLSMQPDGGRLQLGSEDMQLVMPSVFEQALGLQQLSGNLSWEKQPEGLRIEGDGLHYAALGLTGVGRMAVQLGETPSLDLQLDFYCPDPRPWLDFQPLIWNSTLRDWLGGAIEQARVSEGVVRINGPLNRIGRAGSELRVDLALEQARLKFASDWPAVALDSARLLIDGGSLSVEGRDGDIGGVTVSRVTARLPELAQGQLGIEAEVEGEARTIWTMLGASNLRRNMGGVLDALALSGRVRGQLRLDLPLKDLNNTDYRVDVDLDRAALWTRYWPDPIQKISGALRIDRSGLRGRGLSASVAGIPVEVDLQPRDGVTALEARMRLDPAELPPSVPVPGWLKARASGASDWRLDMNIGGPNNGELQFSSNLKGTQWDLPPPFGKTSQHSRRLSIRIVPEDLTRVQVNYEQNLGLDLLLGREGRSIQAARLNLGGTALPAGAPGWWIEGQLAEAGLDEWLPLIQAMISEMTAQATPEQANPEPGFGGLVLRLGQFHALGQALGETRLQLTQLQDEWMLGLTSSRASGKLYFPAEVAQERLNLRAELATLNWIQRPSEPDAEGGLPDPRTLPGLDLRVDAFALNDAPLGALSLVTRPVRRGLHVESLRIQAGERREIDLSGLWLQDQAGMSAALELAADTRNFQNWLTALGYQRNLAAERGQISAQLSWAPHPEGLKPAALSGELRFDFSNGQLLNVEPGAGRVLGLFSINALPRRFFLDFRDVVDTGLGFDSLKGQFQIEQGVARTDNLEVQGTSLRIAARGAVDLAERTYDQTITIYPGVSSGVSLAATVLGGPVVGLFLVFAQELLDKPLDQVTQISYRLGGSWDNPQVSRVQ